jgi:hypothetical protein
LCCFFFKMKLYSSTLFNFHCRKTQYLWRKYHKYLGLISTVSVIWKKVLLFPHLNDVITLSSKILPISFSSNVPTGRTNTIPICLFLFPPTTFNDGTINTNNPFNWTYMAHITNPSLVIVQFK